MTGLNPPLSRESAMDWRVILTKLGPLIGLVFVIAIFSTLRYDTFFTIRNFELILRQTAVVGTAALGMTLIIIAGGIDLSVGSAIALVTVVIGLLLPHYVPDPANPGQRILTSGLHPVLAALGGMGVGILIGALNGTLITRLKLPPFIITLGMLSILRGSAKEFAGNVMVSPKATFLNLLLQPINPDCLWLLTPGAWIMFFLAILIAAMLRYTRFGRHVFAIGSNEQTARLCGVPVERTKLLVYMLAAALAAVAATLQFSYLTLGDPTTAIGMELNIIAAVVIGGASLTGGKGTILGTLVGALIMGVVDNGGSKMGWPNPRQEIITGVIIILAVSLDRLRERGKSS